MISDILTVGEQPQLWAQMVMFGSGIAGAEMRFTILAVVRRLGHQLQTSATPLDLCV